MSTTALALVKKKLTPEEALFLEQVTKPNAKLELVIPDNADRKEWLSCTSLVCRGIARADMQKEALMPVLGRLLLVAKERAEIIDGYDTFEKFLASEVYEKMAVGRSTAYEAMQIASRWPGLTSEEYKTVGRRAFRVLGKAIPVGDENKSFAKALLEKAKEMAVPELVIHCQEKGYLEPGETNGAWFKIGVNKAQLKQLNAFLANPEFRAYCKTENAAKMLLRAIEEATTEWSVQIEEQAKAVPAA